MRERGRPRRRPEGGSRWSRIFLKRGCTTKEWRNWLVKKTNLIRRRRLLLYTCPLDPPLGRSTRQVLSPSLWYHLPFENEDNESRVKFSRYPFRSVFPSEWNINFILSPVTWRFLPAFLLPQYRPSISSFLPAIFKKSLLQRKVNDVLHQTTYELTNGITP